MNITTTTRPLGALLIVGLLAASVTWLLRPDTDARADTDANSEVVQAVPVTDAPELPAAPQVADDAPVPMREGYALTYSGAELVAIDDSADIAVASGGVLLPILSSNGDRLRVLDICNVERWIDRTDAEPQHVPIGPATSFDRAVFVIDAGHGGRDTGAVGPTGLTEKELNLDIADRIRDLLIESRSIDAATGAVTEGSEIPAAGAVVLTRDPDGVLAGDIGPGLTYRAMVANSVDATAFLSIHHNSSPETALDYPGSEAYIQAASLESARLGGLVVEELRTSLARFGTDWEGSTSSGIVARVDDDGEDYYTVLDASASPAAIVEGSYISHAHEEELARTDEYRQVFAEAIYRALVRYVGGDPAPIAQPEPVVWATDTGSLSMANCEVP